jgi:hypothetical protein
MGRLQALLANIRLGWNQLSVQKLQLVTCTIKHYRLVIYRKNKPGVFYLHSRTHYLGQTHELSLTCTYRIRNVFIVQASTTTHSITKHSLTIIRITSLSIKGLFATFSINDTQHINTVIKLRLIMLSVVFNLLLC